MFATFLNQVVLSTSQSYIHINRKLRNCFCSMQAWISCIYNIICKITRKDYKRLSDPTTTLKCHLVSLRDRNKVTVHWWWKPGGMIFMRLYEKRLHKFTYLFCYFAFFFFFFFKSECTAVKSTAFLYVHGQIFLLCTWMCFCSSSLNVHIALKSVLLQGLAYISVIFFVRKGGLIFRGHFQATARWLGF